MPNVYSIMFCQATFAVSVCVYVLASFYTILRISNAIWKIICARMSVHSASSKSLSWAYEVNASRRSRDLKSEVHTAYRLFQAIYKQIFVYLCGTHIDNTLFDHTHHETLLLACIHPYLILESVFFFRVLYTLSVSCIHSMVLEQYNEERFFVTISSERDSVIKNVCL